MYNILKGNNVPGPTTVVYVKVYEQLLSTYTLETVETVWTI